MGVSTDQETHIIEKTVYSSQISRGMGVPHHAGPQGEAPCSVRRWRGCTDVGKSLYGAFPGEGMGEAGKEGLE